LVGLPVHRQRRRDVEDGEPRDGGRKVERHAVRDAAAAIVTGHAEALVAETAHHFELVACHRARRICHAAFAAVGLTRIAVAA